MQAIEEAVKSEDINKINDAIVAVAGPVGPLFKAKQAAEAPPTVDPGEQAESEKPADVVDAEFTEVKKGE